AEMALTAAPVRCRQPSNSSIIRGSLSSPRSRPTSSKLLPRDDDRRVITSLPVPCLRTLLVATVREFEDENSPPARNRLGNQVSQILGSCTTVEQTVSNKIDKPFELLIR